MTPSSGAALWATGAALALPALEGDVRAGVTAIGGYSGTDNVIGSLPGRGLALHCVSGDDALVRAFLRA
jgi:hypothetical protein